VHDLVFGVRPAIVIDRAEFAAVDGDEFTTKKIELFTKVK
jgi:hypothetical protein